MFCIEDSALFIMPLFVIHVFSFLVIFGAFSLEIRGEVLEEFSLWFF